MTLRTIAPQAIDLADLPIPRAEIAALLKGLGIHLDTPLADSHVLATCDTLIALEVASSLEAPFDLTETFKLLRTWSTPQPEPVHLTQQAVLQAAPADALSASARTYLLEQHAQLEVLVD